MEMRVSCVCGPVIIHHHPPTPTPSQSPPPKKQTAPYWSSLCKLRVIVDASESPSTITTDRRFGFLCRRVETGGPLPGVEIAPPTANKVGGKVAGVLEQALHGLNSDLWKELQGLLAP